MYKVEIAAASGAMRIKNKVLAIRTKAPPRRPRTRASLDNTNIHSRDISPGPGSLRKAPLVQIRIPILKIFRWLKGLFVVFILMGCQTPLAPTSTEVFEPRYERELEFYEDGSFSEWWVLREDGVEMDRFLDWHGGSCSPMLRRLALTDLPGELDD